MNTRPAPYITPAQTYQFMQALELSDLTVELRAEWASGGGQDSRLLIRQALAASAQIPNVDWASDLKVLPVDPRFFFSISHTLRSGGFARCRRRATGATGATSQITGLGFDLEALSRVTLPVLRRVSNQRELELARECTGDARPLWAAKEAAFKASSVDHQPKTISEIFIDDWSTYAQDFYTFSAASAHLILGRGALIVDTSSDHVYALFRGISTPV